MSFPGSGPPLFLYSTNTMLAFAINQAYYGDKHFVWCVPNFDAKNTSRFGPSIPPTSCPKEIYLSLAEEVCRGDRHSPKIRENKRGILKGAKTNLVRHRITQSQYDDICDVVRLAQIQDFAPVLYVIQYSAVASLIAPVAAARRANPIVIEYLIEELPRSAFDVITFVA